MATINIEFGKVTKDNKRAVYFIVRSHNKRKRIATNVMLAADEVRGGKIRNIEKKMLINKKLNELQEQLDRMSLNLLGQTLSAQDICERLTRTPEVLEFFTFADAWINRATIKGAKNYRCMLNTLEKYLGCRYLPFDRITYQCLQGFEDYLASKPRAKTLYLGQMRHLYREAMRQYNTDYEVVIKNDPFTRYRVPKQVLKKGVRALTLEQLLRIYRYKGEGRAQLARDCFILSFGLLGMNAADLYTADNIKGGVIRYNRQKTKDRRSDGAYIEVQVWPPIAALVKKYKGSGRVFSFSRRYSTETSFSRSLNIGLKEVGKAVGIADLTFYQARHTFATLSRNLMRFSKSDVDEALNHVGTLDIADVYIKKDFTLINENNKKLLDRVFFGQ